MLIFMLDPDNPQHLAGVVDLVHLQGVPLLHVGLWQLPHHLPQCLVGGGGRGRLHISHLRCGKRLYAKKSFQI